MNYLDEADFLREADDYFRENFKVFKNAEMFVILKDGDEEKIWAGGLDIKFKDFKYFLDNGGELFEKNIPYIDNCCISRLKYKDRIYKVMTKGVSLGL
jgi:hypothetical protein